MQTTSLYPALMKWALIGAVAAVSPLPVLAQEGATDAAGSLGLPSITLSYGDGKTLAVPPEFNPDHPDYGPIGVYPNQELQINLQFPASCAGQKINIGVVEDGAITTPTDSGAVTIGNDGAVSVGYRAPENPGRGHVILQIGSQNCLLPLFVLTANDAVKALAFPKAD
jgi:hypothetical protein